MRGALTLMVIVVAALIVWAVVVGGAKRHEHQPVVATPQAIRDQAPAGAAPKQPDLAEPDETPAAPRQPQVDGDIKPQPELSDIEPIFGLHAETVAEARVAIIGSNNPDDGYKLEVDVASLGASIMRIALTDYHRTVKGEQPYVIAEAQRDPTNLKAVLFPFAARTIWVNGQAVDLANTRWRLHSPTHYRTTFDRSPEDDSRPIAATAEYRLTLLDETNQPAIELRRIYELTPDSYHLRCRQQIINHSGKPVQVVWEQRGQSDIAEEEISYMGDRRMMATGYFDTDYDPGLLRVYADRGWIMRTDLLKDRADTWPDSELNEKDELIWLASLNRYFALVSHPRVPPSAKHAPKLASVFPHVSVEMRGQALEPAKRIMAVVMATDKLTLADQPIEIELDLYAGPRDRDVFILPANKMLGLPALIKYEMSSSCAFCTFQWLANGLLRFLEMIHVVVQDWGVAIIILVLIVRLLLHPVTKKAQVNMMVMGKQMQSLQPELEKLKKKYGDDQKRMQTEQMRLYREKGVNPAGMVTGCLPMFLQMPIWIALYAMLFFAIELRHQPAFYGFFQVFGDWGFLADLSSPDAFIRFSSDPVRMNFPVLSSLDFATLNVLPLVWAVTMYFQQKLTTPPPATEQAAQQQKIMRYMTVLFPLFLYSAPSGLTLYILASTSAGIVDSYMVRKHVKEQEEAGTLMKKKPRKPGGFMDRISKALEQKQREMMQMQDQQKRGDDSGQGNKSPRRKRK